MAIMMIVEIEETITTINKTNIINAPLKSVYLIKLPNSEIPELWDHC